MPIEAYTSPGVTVRETPNPALSTIFIAPSIIAIVGEAAGEQSSIERLVLTGTNALPLRYTGVDVNSVVVKDAATGHVVNPGAYTVTEGTDPDLTTTGDEPYNIARVAAPTAAPGAVANGNGSLSGTYRYAVSFLNSGGETGIGPVSSNVIASGAGINLTNIPAGGAGTTGRNIYREKVINGVGTGFHLVATIADDFTTTLSDESTSDGTAANAPAPVQGIADGGTVIVSYDYTDQHYFTPTLLDDFDDIIDKYGPPYDENGNISSPLTFSARLAMLNGAKEILCVASHSGESTDIEDALLALEDIPEVRFVLSTSGDTEVNGVVVAHVNKMASVGLYRQCIIGADGSTNPIEADVMRDEARAFNNQSVQYVNLTSPWLENPVTGRKLAVGGQYVASALAGMYGARDVQVALTRQTVAGFGGYNDKRTQADLALDSAAGLVVVENRSGVLRVRHNVTTAIGSLATSEGSVVRAKYEMAHRLHDVLDASLIGVVVPITEAPLLVQAATIGVLDSLVSEAVISGYANVKARVLASDPTTVEVKFAYIPMFPINHINIIFVVDVNTGDFNLGG